MLVTGAARRLGREIALDLARHGYDVAVHYRASAADADATRRRVRRRSARAAWAFGADLARRGRLPRAGARGRWRSFGRLDAVVNNASAFEYDDAASFSYARDGRALARQHRRRRSCSRRRCTATSPSAPRAATGCVVNLLDQKLWNPNPDYLSYTLSKAALEAATTLLAQALAPRLRVCGVAPGVTLLSGPMTPTEFAARARADAARQRSSQPEDIARAVRFLIESPAITGTTLLVDGGQHLQAQPRDVMFLARNEPSA